MEIWLARGIPIFQRRKLGLGYEESFTGSALAEGQGKGANPGWSDKGSGHVLRQH